MAPSTRHPRSAGSGRTVRYTDADGMPTEDAGAAAAAEVLDLDAHGRPRRTRFFLKREELPRLPVGELAFLLWVLAALFVLWIVIGVVLRLT